MSIFPQLDTDYIYLSRSDSSHLLGCWSAHRFVLEDAEWPTVEHYFQASKFTDAALRERIRLAPTPAGARKLGRRRWHRPRKDWHQIREIMLSRGLYTKCRTYPEVAAALLATDTRKLVENSLYDYYWGCGRDRLGDNRYGHVLMKVRARLVAEATSAP